MDKVIISIRPDESDDDLRSLVQWLAEVQELRGKVTTSSRPVRSTMATGVLDTVQVAITTGTVTSLVTSLFSWLNYRRRATQILLKFKNGDNELTVVCGNTDDMDRVLNSAQDFLHAHKPDNRT